MASAPPQPPESLVISRFSGLRTNVSEERLEVGDLSRAVNVDLDDAGQIRRRRGTTRSDASAHHSLTDVGGLLHVVRDGMLGSLDVALNFTALVEVGPERLSYVAIGKTIYFSSEVTSGKIVDGAVWPWGQHGGDGVWISPVIRPTETLGAISGKLLTKPPVAKIIEHYKGRIYLANGPVLWATELYLYDHVDRNRNFLQFPDDITMVRAVDDGIYVGTATQLLFLQGVFGAGMPQQIVMDDAVIPGSDVVVPYSKAHPQAKQGPVPEGTGPMFMTTTGICLGLNGGQVYNLTQDRMAFPAGQSAAALLRDDQGATSYTAVVDSAGGNSANTRIGDYVDAEIVRVSQGG